MLLMTTPSCSVQLVYTFRNFGSHNLSTVLLYKIGRSSYEGSAMLTQHACMHADTLEIIHSELCQHDMHACWHACSKEYMQHTCSWRRPISELKNIVDGVLDVYTNVHLYLTIWYWETFCGHQGSLVFRGTFLCWYSTYVVFLRAYMCRYKGFDFITI